MNIKILKDKDVFKSGEVWDAIVNSKRDWAAVFGADDCIEYFYAGEFVVDDELPVAKPVPKPLGEDAVKVNMMIRDFFGGEFAKLKIDVEFK